VHERLLSGREVVVAGGSDHRPATVRTLEETLVLGHHVMPAPRSTRNKFRGDAASRRVERG
jgi:hypothetical protein